MSSSSFRVLGGITAQAPMWAWKMAKVPKHPINQNKEMKTSKFNYFYARSLGHDHIFLKRNMCYMVNICETWDSSIAVAPD